MKRLLLVIALILGFCGIANAQCSTSQNCIQFVATACGGATSCTATVTSTAANHAYAMGVLYNNNSSQAVTSVTDGTNTYTAAFNLTNLGTHFTSALFYVCNPTSGITAVTANYPASGSSVVFFVELKNIATTSCLDVNTSNGNSCGGTCSQAFSGGTATTANATDTFIGLGLDENEGNATFAAGTGTGGTVWTNINGANTGVQVGGGSTNCGTAFIATTSSTVTDNLVYTGSVTHTVGYFGDYAAFKGTSSFNADGGTTISQKETEKNAPPDTVEPTPERFGKGSRSTSSATL